MAEDWGSIIGSLVRELSTRELREVNLDEKAREDARVARVARLAPLIDIMRAAAIRYPTEFALVNGECAGDGIVVLTRASVKGGWCSVCCQDTTVRVADSGSERMTAAQAKDLVPSFLGMIAEYALRARFTK